jgi:CheY-like chemotaxis protein
MPDAILMSGSERVEGSGTAKKRILIIDDDVAIRTTCRHALRSDRWSVTTAASAEEGLQILKEEPIDLIFLDLKLPAMDGFEFLKTVRSEAFHIPIVLTSAFYQRLTSEDAEKLGGLGFLPRPFSPEQLRIAASRLLAESKETTGKAPN